MLGICDSVITSLANVSEAQYSVARATNPGALLATMDEDNSRGIEFLDPNREGGNGAVSMVKVGAVYVPRIRVRYYQPSLVPTKTIRDCLGSTAVDPLEVNFDLTQYAQRDVTIPLDMIRSLCEGATAVKNSMMPDGYKFQMGNNPTMNHIATLILREVREFIKEINSKVIAKINANTGVNARVGTNAPQNIALLNTLGQLRADGIARISGDYAFNELMGNPLIIGGDRTFIFNTQKAWAGASGEDGNNFEKQSVISPYKFFYDLTADSVFGANQFRALGEGLVKFMSISKKEAYEAMGGKLGVSSYGSFVIPGMEDLDIGVRIIENGCDENITAQIYTYYDTFVAPQRYAVGDRLAGVTGILPFTGVVV
jgi:hypothetical protein